MSFSALNSSESESALSSSGARRFDCSFMFRAYSSVSMRRWRRPRIVSVPARMSRVSAMISLLVGWRCRTAVYVSAMRSSSVAAVSAKFS